MMGRQYLLDIFKAWDISAIAWRGWRDRGDDKFDPVGVMNHHTGSRRGTDTPELDRIVRDKLANLYISRRPTLYIVSSGRANHAGMGMRDVVGRVGLDLPPRGDARDIYGVYSGSGDIPVNRYYIGIEVENDGIGEPYSKEQLDLLFRVNAALCNWYGWSSNRCIMHRESTSRKIDMSWRGDLRGEVQKRLSGRKSFQAPNVGVPPIAVAELEPTVTVEFTEEDLKYTDVTIPHDTAGNGYVDVPDVSIANFVSASVIKHPDPARVGAYIKAPKLVVAEGFGVRVVVEDGFPTINTNAPATTRVRVVTR